MQKHSQRFTAIIHNVYQNIAKSRNFKEVESATTKFVRVRPSSLTGKHPNLQIVLPS